jgi:hypothetical protein
MLAEDLERLVGHTALVLGSASEEPLVAREAGAHFVQAFLGHSRLSTTERYLHAKSRPQDVETLNRAFAFVHATAEASE